MTPRPARTILGACPGDPPPCALPRGPEPGGLRLVPAAAEFTPVQLETFVTRDHFTVGGEGTGDGDPGRPLDAVGAGLGRDPPMIGPARPARDRAGRSASIHPVTRPGTT